MTVYIVREKFKRCRFGDTFCQVLVPCTRCTKLMNLEVQKAELEVEEARIHVEARRERAADKAREEAIDALGEAIVKNPKTSMGVGLGLLGLFIGSAVLDAKRKK